MASDVAKVLVVGGGIAGLSAAVALGHRGVKVKVVDLHSQAEGASIGITNREVDALEELGVLSAATAAGIALARSRFASDTFRPQYFALDA